jgi:hypothetical protein
MEKKKMDKRLRLANEFLEEAREQLKKHEETKKELNLRQACEKGWGSVAQALKAVNPKIRYHRDFGETAAKLARKYNQQEIVHGEMCGEALHRSGFYEGSLGVLIVEDSLKCIDNFLKSIDNIQR